ncbi:alkylation response protein AidB-like acyl-CoA dehydrogenase [Catenulispora sp. GAS73]|uniref:acyl-CoA dehydrogenase family protein n=1 Tax=Catenulispora sp. GAS73 TaxID=3156269 RepID=UPI0035128DE7
MRFDPEQEELRRTVRTLLERAAGGNAWRLLAEQVGALGLAIPEEYGGAGFSVLETHVVLEELGAALAVPGFLSTTLAAQAILAGDSAKAKAELLPGIAEGATRAAVAWEASGVTATEEASGWRLTGTADHVLDGSTANLLIVPAQIQDHAKPALEPDTRAGLAPEPDARAELVQEPHPRAGLALEPDIRTWSAHASDAGSSRIGMFVVAAGDAAVSEVETVDPGRPQAWVEFRTSPAMSLGADPALSARVLDLACVAISAEQVGAAQRAFDLTLAYTKQRVQFGRPIGSFQAVKHRLADLFVLLESARSASYAAAFAAASGHELTVAASRAKAYCSEAFATIAGEAIQLHGGIGITWEHPIHLYFKRAHSTSQLFGNPAWHRQRYARAVGLAA